MMLASVGMFVAWFLVGPMNIRLGETAFDAPMLALSFFVLAIAAPRASRLQSLALLSALVAVFCQSLSAIEGWVRFHLSSPPLPNPEGFHMFFVLNFSLALAGVVAALAFAASLKFRNLRLPLATLFPEVTFLDAPTELTLGVERLSNLMGVKSPQVAVVDSGEPAAFITSSKQGRTLAVSVGLLESMSPAELNACLAHELSHLKNNDLILRSFATATRIAVFAHPLGHVIEPALYRAREFQADRTASGFVGRHPLISALTKLRESQHYSNQGFEGSTGTACFLNHVSTNRLIRLFDKHPTLESRIMALKELDTN
jgi:heat shock protein HtpX